MITAKLEDNLF